MSTLIRLSFVEEFIQRILVSGIYNRRFLNLISLKIRINKDLTIRRLNKIIIILVE